MKRLFLVFFTLPFILSACASNYTALPVDSGPALVNSSVQEQDTPAELADVSIDEQGVLSENRIVPVTTIEEIDLINKQVEEVIVDSYSKETTLSVKQDVVVDVPLSNNNTYVNVDGNEVHSPAYAPSVPVGASAVCRDGTYSFSQNRRGTCSGHGGVARWL